VKGKKFPRRLPSWTGFSQSTCTDSSTYSVEQSNIAVAAVGVVVCVLRWLLVWFKYRLGCIELVYDILLGGLWYASLSGQSASDMSDHDHLSARPWYLEKNCDAAKSPAASACALMQAQWAMSIFVL